MRETYEKLYWRLKFTAIGLMIINGLVQCVIDFNDSNRLITTLALLVAIMMWLTKRILPFDLQNQLVILLALAGNTTIGAFAAADLHWEMASLMDSATTVAYSVLTALGDLALLSYWQSSNSKPRRFRL